MLEDAKILVTGPTSQVGLPVIQHFAERNEVWGIARFSRPDDRERIEAFGARAHPVDFAEGDFSGLPADFDYVLNFAVIKTGEFAFDLRANAEGVGKLMSHCRNARAFLHCSTGGVYDDSGPAPIKETDPLGDNHRVMMPTYSISKIAAESVVRFAADQWQIPTTIARLSVPYGNNGGWPWYHLMMMNAGAPIPVHTEQPSRYNLLHEDDYIRTIPGLLELATVDVTTLNWGGNEATSIQDWCAWLGELTGLEPKFEYTDQTLKSIVLDTTLLQQKLGPTRVDWRDGIRRLVETRNPELLKG
jgi:UDP-glucuronate 4-epimerase